MHGQKISQDTELGTMTFLVQEQTLLSICHQSYIDVHSGSVEAFELDLVNVVDSKGCISYYAIASLTSMTYSWSQSWFVANIDWQ